VSLSLPLGAVCSCFEGHPQSHVKEAADNQVWWGILVITALSRRQRQEDREFEASLGLHSNLTMGCSPVVSA
jgi:hypothetical protein